MRNPEEEHRPPHVLEITGIAGASILGAALGGDHTKGLCRLWIHTFLNYSSWKQKLRFNVE